MRVLGAHSLLDAALAHARRFAGPGRVWIVCTEENVSAIRAASGLPRSRVLVEPQGRNTAMAVAFAATRVAMVDADAVLAVLPADHVIPDARAFGAALGRAARAAQTGALVTLGIQPTRAETGYGYIQVGADADPAHPGLHRVRRFVEKPSAARAKRMLRARGHLWNAGIFVWMAASILAEIERCTPELSVALAGLRNASTRAALRRAYDRARSLPIDVAVLERSDRVWTLPVDFQWSDVGNWASLAAELGVVASRSCVVEGEALLEDAAGNLIWGHDRLIALLGVEGLAVVDTGDALLVARLDRCGDVRALVKQLKARGRSDLL